MARQRILIVDDKQDVLELLENRLVRNGYVVTCATTGEQAAKSISTERPDLVLIDPMLSNADGPEICRRLRQDQDTRDLPIIIMTDNREDADMAAALELGADDYVTRPFSSRVLSARIKAVLRRNDAGGIRDVGVTQVGDLTVDPRRHEVCVRGKAVSLTYLEFRILQFLSDRAGWVFSRHQIIEAIQERDVAIADRSIDVHMVNLRRKLAPCGDYIETVRSVGYRLRDARRTARKHDARRPSGEPAAHGWSGHA